MAVGDGGLNRFGDIEIHPIVGDGVDEVNIAADVNTDVAPATLGPVVGAVVGGCVGRCRPRLKHGANGDRFVLSGAVFRKETQFSTGDTCAGGLWNFCEWDSNQRRRLVARGLFTNTEGGRVLMGVVSTRTVFDDIGVYKVRRVEMGQSTVMTQFNRGLRGVEHDRVQIGELEVIGRRPVSNLVGRRNGAYSPVPGLAVIEVGLERERGVGHIKSSIVPRGVGQAVDRCKVVLRVELYNVACQRHRTGETPDQFRLGDGRQINAAADGPRTVGGQRGRRVAWQGIRTRHVHKGQFRSAGHRVFGRAEVGGASTARTSTEHAGDEIHATIFPHGVLDGKGDVPFHSVPLRKRVTNAHAVEE